MPWFESTPIPGRGARYWIGCAAVTLAYLISGRLGLLLAVPPGYATAIFPPAGIAMAAAFIGGPGTLPWIFLSSCLLNLWVGFAIDLRDTALILTMGLLIPVASVAQAAIGGYTLRRLISYPAALDNPRDLARFLFTSPIACVTSASISVGGMAALGMIRGGQIGSNWFAWWIGDTLGVLFFLPLVMVVAGEPRTFWRSRVHTVALPMLLFFALFVAIFIRTRAWERDQSLASFQQLSQGFADTLESKLLAQDNVLTQLRASWMLPNAMSQQDFVALTQHLLQRFPAIQAIEWAPRTTTTTAGAQYPVTFVEPLAGNEAALGFDLASDPVRATAIREAVATGTATATAPIRLVQNPSDPTGMLLTLGVPQSPNGPGVLLIVLGMHRFVEAVLGPARSSLEVQLIDRQADQALFDSITGTPDYRQTISFGGRSYQITTAPTEFYLAGHRSWQSWAVLVIGVLSTSLLGALLMLNTGERQRFEGLVTERTRERDRIWQVSEDLLGVGNFEGYFPSVNPAWTRTLGWTEEEIRTLHVDDLRHPDDTPIGREGRRRLAEGAGTVRLENRFRHKDGSYRWIYWTMTAEQGLIYVIGRDVTADKAAALAHRETEDQLRQLQKMDSVGQLTGGIAHDFNNLLTVIIGNLELLEGLVDAGSPRAMRAVRAAMSGATRAATLTQRLLAYAQRQPLRPAAVNLNELIMGMGELIRRTQGEMIEYQFALADNLPLCFCDANQLETALLNLVINARDAMPQGGRLKIETGIVAFDTPQARSRGIASGPYVMLAVSDTGSGMSRDVVEHAFEPFFTTKDVGKGTGLGLSMVYGFVKQSNGHVEIDSVPNRGTTLRIVLPALAVGMAPDARSTDTVVLDAGGRGRGETILVAEDDDGVRSYVMTALRELGYRVLEASDATVALETIGQSNMRVDLLLSDVVMPGMNGRELANRARALQPNIRVLFMTGYSQDAFVHQGRLDPDIELIEKPFRSERLAARVRATLDAEMHTA